MRSFLGWTAPALPRAAALLADRYARGPELRIDPATVVLPGARAGRRLKELLLEEAERRELRLVPPRITTVGALPELLYEPPHPFAEPALIRRLWVRALRLLPAERLVRLLSVPPADADLLGWTRTAAMIDGLHRDVGGGGLRFREVVGACAEGLLFCDEERWSVLAQLQDTVGEELRGLERTDRHLARIDALQAGSVRLEGDIWLLGVAEMPRITRRMLEAAISGEHRLRLMIHAPEAESEAFDALGCVRPEAWLGREIPLRDAQIAVRGRPPDQAREVVRTLSALDGRHAADDIVVALPDPALIPYLERHLEAAGVPVRAADGMPVERSAPYRLLSAIADYLQGGRFDALAALARHPDLGRRLRRSPSGSAGAAALGEEDGWLEPLDRYFARHLPALVREVVQESDEGRVVEALRTALQHPHLLGELRGRKRSAEWPGALLELLAEVYGGAPLNRAVPEERLLLQFLEAFRDAAAEMSRIPEAVDEACDAPTAIRLLLDGVEGAMVAPAAERAAVELLGWLEIHLDDAPVVVVAGFNEPFLPASLNAHAYLPNALRARIGLVDNDGRYARDAYQLTALLHSRAEVRVIAGRRTAEDDPLRPSRLMFAVQGGALAERVRRFYGAGGDDGSAHSEGGTEKGELRTPLSLATPARSSRFHLPPEPELRVGVRITTLPVTAFRGLIQNPYGYALEKILRLESVDDTAREMDALAFGALAHEVLEAFGHSPELHSADAERIRTRLRGLLDERIGARFRGVALPAVRIQGE
ncbi:MAG: PD-(D/E)XK nuclease family protein, partial [Gemmatimonadota bacterium]|nr:PD-(D/E)XK nuclease family protein [Gemmatimonadota bacterium]